MGLVVQTAGSTHVELPGGHSRRGDVEFSQGDAGPVDAGPVDTGVLVPGPVGDTAGEQDHSRSGNLFGRDLLYVGVLSLHLVTATVVSPVLDHVLPGDEFGHL